MTQRKPAGMPIGNWVEAQILQAQREGKFDHLDAAADPLEGIDGPYDPDWWLKKLIQREQLNTAPVLLLLKREVAEFHAGLALLGDEAEIRAAIAGLNQRIREANLSNTAPLCADLGEIDEVRTLRTWRQARAPR